MEAKYLEIINQLTNPITGKKLGVEQRVVELLTIENKIQIKYDGTGLEPKQKRQIEDVIHNALLPHFDEKAIMLMSYSKNGPTPTHKEEASKDAAKLQVGHGTMAPKKRVNKVKKVIAVASGKGGVGKSTFSVNLALSLSKRGRSVGLIDADIYGPSIPMLLNKRDAKPFANDDKKIIPVEAFGIKFMSFGFFISENDPVIWRGPMLGGVLNQFLFDVDWGDTDYLIIDLPPGTGDMQLSMVQATEIDGVIIISTPQDVALLDATKGLNMFVKLGLPVIGMVENMSSFVCDNCDKEHFIFGQGGVKRKVEQLNTEFIGAIPLELALREGSDNGTPYMSSDKFSKKPAWKAYTDLSAKIDKKYF